MSYRTEYLDQDNRRMPKTGLYCIACHKDLKPGRSYLRVHLVDGGPFMLAVADEAKYDNDHPGNLGVWPVGPECARRIDKDFLLPEVPFED